MHGIGMPLLGSLGEQLFCLLGIGFQVAEAKEIPLAQLFLCTGGTGLGFSGEGFQVQRRKWRIGCFRGAQAGIGALPG